MLSAHYSPLVDIVCRAMILAAIALGLCAIPVFVVYLLWNSKPHRAVPGNRRKQHNGLSKDQLL